MKVSVVQMNMRSLAGKENFDRAEALIRRAARETAPDVILLRLPVILPRGRPLGGQEHDLRPAQRQRAAQEARFRQGDRTTAGQPALPQGHTKLGLESISTGCCQV